MFEAGPPGFLLPNKRTNARIVDIRSLEERLPWTTVVDRYLFLEGWSKGYEYGSSVPARASYGSDTRQTQTLPSSSSPSPQTQNTSAASDHISEAMPAAIAGVTRKDEHTRQKL
jgi:hypothetical protein